MWASNQRVYEALEQLDKNRKQKARLMRYAEYRAKRVRIHVRHADAEDLYQEALLRTADARRICSGSDENDLYWHLRQTISSIANEWVRANYGRNFDLPKHPTPAQVACAPEGATEIDRRRLAHELMRWFATHDPEAEKVLTLLQYDYKPREIQQELCLSVTDYDRIRKRIARHGKSCRKALYSLQ